MKTNKIKCDKCSNIWDYKGEKLRATCTSCGLKVDVSKNKVK